MPPGILHSYWLTKHTCQVWWRPRAGLRLVQLPAVMDVLFQWDDEVARPTIQLILAQGDWRQRETNIRNQASKPVWAGG